MAAGNPTTPTTIDQAAWAQATYLGDAYATIKRYLIQWQVNATNTSQMTAIGYTNVSNQAQVLQHIENLNTLVSVIEGTQTTATGHVMIADIAALRGVNG